ncbi:MAG: ATP-binding cassette domain-containing protein [Rudaea sp.]|uniref:ATP-binding cassette domain-containing protein n=1 Tax=unclassified Rudaea TaxID=2627037 RepID=UPI0010F8A4A7|nr:MULTISPECIES: ATP-binding cassette domain-containing protein [unclassified Rudaea]MBN8884994.1 ATP-binding cassette domain-containing protein [Rudaea sp.]
MNASLAAVLPFRETTVELRDLQFAWRGAAPLLDIENLSIARGERVFLQGASGSGKSTLLGLLAGVLLPQRGAVRVLGNRINDLRGAQRDRFRADHIGFVFQMFNLLPFLSVRENILLACRFSALRSQQVSERGTLAAEADRLLAALDLDPALIGAKAVGELSIGQQQRVAVARALIGAPELVIADEPTSALDADARAAFLGLLFAECQRAGTTLVFVSHDDSLAPRFDRRVALAEINRAALPVRSARAAGR